MIATIIPTDVAGIISEQLDSPIEDVVAIQRTTTCKLYHATWQTHEGPLPIVIRFYQGTRCEEAARVEAAALRSLLNAGYPVPELYLAEADSHIAGAPFIVMQRLPGRTLSEIATEEPDSIPYWIDQASSLMLRLHTAQWQDGFDFFHPAMGVLEFAERQVKWWSIQAHKAGAQEAKAGFDWLKSNVYRARECSQQVLVHRNFHANNLLSDGQHITGVLDWGELAIADPAVDVAWSRMVLETEVSQQVGDNFNDSYQRRHPEVVATQPFWEVFSACKRLTSIAIQQRTTDEIEADDAQAPRQPQPTTNEALQAFMHKRLVDEE
ncbi:MAG: phosphotransferase [Anaerolineae bacterium]|nr:phosphotransferase [Anaerolineae bacterium]